VAKNLTESKNQPAKRHAMDNATRRRATMRRFVDKLASKIIGLGGISVILAVSLIFIFLLIQIIPLFTAAKITPIAEITTSDARSFLWADIDERGEVLSRAFVSDEGLKLVLQKLPKKSVQSTTNANSLPAFTEEELELVSKVDMPIDSVRHAAYDQTTGWFVVESDNRLHVGQVKEQEVYDPESGRSINAEVNVITPDNGYKLNVEGDISQLSIRLVGKDVVISAIDSEGIIQVLNWKVKKSFLSDDVTYTLGKKLKFASSNEPDAVYIGNRMRWIYAVHTNGVEVFNSRSKPQATQGSAEKLIKPYNSVSLDESITSSALLLGAKSLLIGTANGDIEQWSLVKDKNNRSRLKSLRSIHFTDNPIKTILPEERRRGFYAVDSTGQTGAFFTTSERQLAQWQLPKNYQPGVELFTSPRSNRVIAPTQSGLAIYGIKNDHPEVSFGSIWKKVWYEGYDEPEYIWQSSAATNDFEPKFSLSPLAFGTLKATFYAILFALPLAISGAIYTAYFMAPKVRTKVKPCIEFMEALPTVILGFLAGVWLAPLVEIYLPGVLMTLIAMPVSILIASLLWFKLPKNYKTLLPEGWEPIVLMPIVILAVAGCFYFSVPLENYLFGGDARIWMRDNLGISYDQRNSLVVGIAMGFAVIPTIFSIAEDAVFAVPKSLSYGSLALGASPWQSLVRVVLPTASPGIFSAVMIGTGRAVGETMIVLMATGSTPIMDMNIFEGFRTLSANIAIEMPEAEVHSTHYRLLFLAAFCLFMFTFVFNTTAEIVRQRLREKYGSL